MKRPIENRQRVEIIATFEIPGGSVCYKDFRKIVYDDLRELEQSLGSDAVLEYAALVKKSVDMMGD